MYRADPRRGFGGHNAGDEIGKSENIDFLCRRAKEVCAHTRHNLRHTADGTDDEYARRHSNVYATTFGTRCRSCSEDKGITVVNIYPKDDAKPKSPKYEHKPVHDDCQRDTGLPYWHIAEAAARAKDEEQKYNRRRAAEAWDSYFSSICSKERERLENLGNSEETRKAEQERKADLVQLPEKNKEQVCNAYKCMKDVCSHAGVYKCKGKIEGCPIATSNFESTAESSRSDRLEQAPFRYGRNETEVVLPVRPGTRSYQSATSFPKYEKGNVGGAEEMSRCSGHGLEAKEDAQRKRNRSAPPQICRPFYGTTELEKSSLNAINHLLKAEKELRKVQFTAGSVIPKAQQYVEQVNTIHNDLKQFNTLFRDLQKQTDEVLEQKGARHFHFVIQGSPTKLKTAIAPPLPR